MTHRLPALLVLAAVSVGAVSADAKPAKPKTVTIAVEDDVFTPATKTVKRGTKLKFVWDGENPHDVVATGAATQKSKLQETGTFSFRAKKKGTIELACTIHYEMRGTIKVK